MAGSVLERVLDRMVDGPGRNFCRHGTAFSLLAVSGQTAEGVFVGI